MKRQSKAEEALATQVRSLQGQIAQALADADAAKARAETLRLVKEQLEDQIGRLARARFHASEIRKPKETS
jgi:hypothetical protein